MLALVHGDTLQCPHCHSTDTANFFLERKVKWREPIREMFQDGALLVLIAECDQTTVDMTNTGPDELYCNFCGERSTIDVTTKVHHEDPKD